MYVHVKSIHAEHRFYTRTPYSWEYKHSEAIAEFISQLGGAFMRMFAKNTRTHTRKSLDKKGNFLHQRK